MFKRVLSDIGSLFMVTSTFCVAGRVFLFRRVRKIAKSDY